MAKNKSITNELTNLAETLKNQMPAVPEQTTIPTVELETLKEKAEQPVSKKKGRRKDVCSFTLSTDLISCLDTERGKAPFNPSRSEFVEHILREYLKDKL